ncbi:MAG: glycine betaine ABC transporter substrate-binding protein [Pseudomonadota bacterium]
MARETGSNRNPMAVPFTSSMLLYYGRSIWYGDRSFCCLFFGHGPGRGARQAVDVDRRSEDGRVTRDLRPPKGRAQPVSVGLDFRLGQRALRAAAAAACLLAQPIGAASGLAAERVPSREDACGAPMLIAEFAWDTARLAAELAAITLRRGYGCAVLLTAAEPQRAIQAIAAADPGEYIIAVDAPDGPDAPMSVAQGAATFGGAERSGWFVPKWLADANPELRSAADVAAHPEIFTSADAGEARPTLHICPAAWSCHARDLALIKSLGLDADFNIVTPPSGEALTAALVDAWERRRPWVGSYWSPSTALAQYPMAALENAAAGAVAGSEQGSEQGTADARVTLYPSAMAERAPRVAAFLNRFGLTPDYAHEALAWRAEANASMADAALRLLRTRPELWRNWVDEPAAARLQATVSGRMSGQGAQPRPRADNRPQQSPRGLPPSSATRG